MENGFLETTFQIFLYFFLLRKLVNEKYFIVKKTFDLVYSKLFSFLFLDEIHFSEVIVIC
jgi:hypothetical protein